jgi:hypothetical protein
MGMTIDDARRIVLEYLKQLERDAGCELVMLDANTLEREFGWVFFYNSKRYVETGDICHALAGNAPIVVTSRDRRIHVTGTARPVEHYLATFAEYKA